jgi:pimeloyl-ACP methyl ester carboxylesterase
MHPVNRSAPSHVCIEGAHLEVQRLPGHSGLSHPPTLVFLHEGLGSVAMWHQKGRHWPSELCQATGLSGLVYSRRGYGDSSPIERVREPHQATGFWRAGRHRADYMHFEALEVLPRLLKALGIERPVLVGHSDGATIALLHSAHLPVAATVAMAPHVFVENVALTAIAQARHAYQTATLRQRLTRYHRNVDNAFWQWNDVWLSEDFRHFDIRAECQRIRAPLLLVQGMQDAYGTMRQLAEIALAAPHTQSVELADCGHSPHRDQPQKLTQAVLDFLGAAGLAVSAVT